MEENAIAEVVTEEAVAVSTNGGKKSGLVISITSIAALAAGLGVYKLVKLIRAKKQAKNNNAN